MRFLAFTAIVLLVVAATVFAGTPKPAVQLRQFTAVEVENFENPKFETKEPMPESWIPLIREDIAQRLIALHKFARVADFEDGKVTKPEKERVLVIRGKITEYSQGSQAARMLVGFGAGKGKIVAMLQYVDKETGQVIWERKVDGRVIGAGQSTEGAIKGLSNEVAKVTESNY